MSQAEDMQKDPIFEEEQARLDEIYAELVKMRQKLEAIIGANDVAAAETMKDFAEEIHNEADIESDEVAEAAAAIEAVNSIIDAYNVRYDNNVDKLRRILLLMVKPYFAKVRLKITPDRPARDFYIGTTGVTDEHRNPLIVDWRNPIAETYYSQENGPTSYVVNGRVRHVNLELRRQFDIKLNKLKAYFDTTIAIEDPLLLNALSHQHSEKLKDITATIQREQNEIIRHKDVPVLLVNGIAGSGKTSVMLQRIAYLFYQERESLMPEQVYLFTPNKVFEQYINNVLPSLGETNPNLYTWQDFCESRGIFGKNLGVDTSIENLKKLEREVSSYPLQEADFKEIGYPEEDLVFLTPKDINASASPLYLKYGLTPRFRTHISNKLEAKLDTKLRKLAKEEDYQDEMFSLKKDLVRKLFADMCDENSGEPAVPETEEEVAKYTFIWLKYKYRSAYRAINTLSWLRLDRIAMNILDQPSANAVELMYLQMLITERGDDKARFVMIDEVQDYTLAQLAVIMRYFRRAHFLMLGDENQAIREGTAAFSEIKELFKTARGEVDECRLLTSYRSSPEITALFSTLVKQGSEIKLASVRREGVSPTIKALPDRESFLSCLRELIDKAAQEKGSLCGIVAADDGAVNWLSKQLGDSVITLSNNRQSKDDKPISLPASGVVLLSLRLAKGLEFDEVIIPDASKDNYPDTPLARRQLYTAISRAMHRVDILAQGELSPLLKED